MHRQKYSKVEAYSDKHVNITNSCFNKWLNRMMHP
jgi:hypothetical protein